MAQKKIIFLIIVGIVLVALGVGLTMLNSKEKKVVTSGKVTIWINEGTTENFQKLIDGFHAASPDNKNIQVTVEKKSTTTTSGYNTLLLTAIADKAGPDIFMLPRGEDANLESQIAQIPNGVVDVADFERRFDAVFSDLVVDNISEDKKTKTQSLLGVPLGYETLGVFYNRALLRAGAPRDWQQVELLYEQFPAGKFPTNLGLGKNFVPNVSDVIALFLVQEQVNSYDALSNVSSPFQKYYTYGDLSIWGNIDPNNIYAQNDTLRRSEQNMSEQKPARSTLDEFMRGNIGMIIGYQSLIFDLEAAQKRAGTNVVSDLVYTDIIPQTGTNEKINLARYDYFAISKNSENGEASARFMNYLMSEDAGRIAMEMYPHLIPSQSGLQLSAQGKELSSTFPRAKIDPFMPQVGMTLHVFNYGFKETFRNLLDQNWDLMASRTSLSWLGDAIVKGIQAQMTQYGK